MGILDKFKRGGGGASGEGGAVASGGGDDGFKPDPRKARAFFKHAETTADAGNFDYSIECYVNGMRHEPDTMSRHEALYEVAKRRKVKGGKPAGMGEKMKSLGPRPIDKMLHAEKIWAKNILDPGSMFAFLKTAADADGAHPEYSLGEVAYWIGGLLLEQIPQKKSSKKMLVETRDLLAKVEAFDLAVNACRRAAALDPNNGDLLQDLKQLEASNAMQKGGYNRAGAEEGGFREHIRDAAKQRALEQDESVSKTANQIDEAIARRRAEYEEDPQDHDRMLKLADALVQKETDEAENEAVEMLKEAFEETSSYRYKVRAGDIRMKQMNRQFRALRNQSHANPQDTKLRQQLEQFRRDQLRFELEEYTERVKNYPTDLSLKFDLGLRLFQSGQIDEAIGAFQQSKADPKRRTLSHIYLGQCYLQKGWLDEAIDTLHTGLAAHPVRNDKLGLDLQYVLMSALEQSATKKNDLDQAKEAREIGSNILQTNISYRDIRDRVDKLRALVEKLSG